jgi:hypothetical protein
MYPVTIEESSISPGQGLAWDYQYKEEGRFESVNAHNGKPRYCWAFFVFGIRWSVWTRSEVRRYP